MTVADFWEKIFEQSQLPFEYDEVDDIIILGGMPFIQLKNGDTYSFTPKLLKRTVAEETVSDD